MFLLIFPLIYNILILFTLNLNTLKYPELRMCEHCTICLYNKCVFYSIRACIGVNDDELFFYTVSVARARDVKKENRYSRVCRLIYAYIHTYAYIYIYIYLQTHTQTYSRTPNVVNAVRKWRKRSQINPTRFASDIDLLYRKDVCIVRIYIVILCRTKTPNVW